MTALTLTQRKNISRRTAASTTRRAGKTTAKVKKAIQAGRKAVADATRAIDDRISKATGIEFEWCDAAVTVAGAASAVAGRHRIRRGAEKRFHDCGHWSRYKEINDYIDSVKGRNHRLKGGTPPSSCRAWFVSSAGRRCLRMRCISRKTSPLLLASR